MLMNLVCFGVKFSVLPSQAQVQLRVSEAICNSVHSKQCQGILLTQAWSRITTTSLCKHTMMQHYK